MSSDSSRRLFSPELTAVQCPLTVHADFSPELTAAQCSLTVHTDFSPELTAAQCPLTVHADFSPELASAVFATMSSDSKDKVSVRIIFAFLLVIYTQGAPVPRHELFCSAPMLIKAKRQINFTFNEKMFRHGSGKSTVIRDVLCGKKGVIELKID